MTLLQQAAQHLQAKQYSSASQCYRQLIQAQPQHGQAWYGLGYIAQCQQQWADAVEYLQQACQFLPKQPAPLLGLANAFNQVFSETDALTVLEYGQQQCPTNESIQYALTQQYLIMGDIDAATLLLQQLLTSTDDERFGFACLDAAKINVELLLPIHLQRAQRFVTEQPQHSASIRLHYTLGMVAKHQHDYTNAMSHWDAANALQYALCDFTVEDMAGLFDALQTIDVDSSPLDSSPLDHHTTSDDSPLPFSSLTFTPVFIVGLPRTGSSLLDKQVCDLSVSAQRIASVGEVDYIATQCARMLEQLTGYTYPACLEHLTDELCHTARQGYVDAIGQHRTDADYIIDKLPANFQSLPLIYRLFPEAKVLHLTRDLAATALSIYSNDFGAAEPYFCNLSQMQQYFSHYTAVMHHLTAIYSSNMHTLRYEDLVHDPQGQMTLVSDYLGLTAKAPNQLDDGNAGVSEIQTQGVNGVIKTLSSIQARQPIYQSSTRVPDELADYFTFS
ncbi:MAG: sulfotransferase [Glaciecola sp.]|nr:sulfotransferase [Glaciecola sp.]